MDIHSGMPLSQSSICHKAWPAVTIGMTWQIFVHEIGTDESGDYRALREKLAINILPIPEELDMELYFSLLSQDKRTSAVDWNASLRSRLAD
jgi:hypothetical protein